MGIRIFLDDERKVPDMSWTLVKNSRTALIMLDGLRQQRIRIEALSLDHDLSIHAGIDDTSRPVMLYMCEHDYWPDNLYIHTSNLCGEEWLVGMAKRYGPRNVLKGYGHNLWKHG